MPFTICAVWPHVPNNAINTERAKVRRRRADAGSIGALAAAPPIGYTVTTPPAAGCNANVSARRGNRESEVTY